MSRSLFAEEIVSDDLIGNVLLSNTIVCEASRLVSEPLYSPVRSSDVLRVRDLMSLIDSAVLHERIFYLPARLPDYVDWLSLRNSLVKCGALAPIPRADDHEAIGHALVASLGTAEGLHRHGERSPLAFEDIKWRLIGGLGLATATDERRYGVFRRGEQWEPLEYFTGVAVSAKSFDEAAQDLIEWLDYARSGAYEPSVQSLRAMYYLFASEHYGLPYLASANTGELGRNFPNYFQPSVREKLYQQLASALRGTVETIAQEFDGHIVFVPPFSALVLYRAATREGIPTETLALREEYSDFRKKISELERDRLEARSLNDRLKVLRQIERLGKEVVRPFDQPSQMKLQPALRYVPDALELVTNPTNPAKWTKVLLGWPASMLISWYRRRPVSKLVRTAKAIGALPDYERLLTKHFGEELASLTLREEWFFQEVLPAFG